MPKLIAFNSISLDGYFVDMNGDFRWAENGNKDPEWDAYVAGNARGDGVLLFGRKTYDLMASYWPTPVAHQNNPAVAEGMNRMPKVVFSKTLAKPAWENTRLVSGDPPAAVRKMKQEPGRDMVIMGSGSVIAQLAQERLIDEYQFIVVPVVIGKGRTMFEGVKERLPMKLIQSRAFRNGNVLLRYEPAG